MSSPMIWLGAFMGSALNQSGSPRTAGGRSRHNAFELRRAAKDDTALLGLIHVQRPPWAGWLSRVLRDYRQFIPTMARFVPNLLSRPSRDMAPAVHKPWSD